MIHSKWALVTGGCTRIGAYINEQLAKQGWNLVLHFNSSEQQALELQSKLESIYCIKTLLWQQDLTKCDQIEASLLSISNKLPKIDLLINNASIFNKGDIQTSSLDLIQKNMDVHLTAPWLLTQFIANQTTAENPTQVINILDANLTHRYTSKSAYFISKKALETLTELSAIELAPSMRVNALAFGFVLPPEDSSNDIDKSDMNLMQQPVDLEQIINSINFLNNNKTITGQIINLDGGSHLKCPPYMLRN